jgi:hypothetical protein
VALWTDGSAVNRLLSLYSSCAVHLAGLMALMGLKLPDSCRLPVAMMTNGQPQDGMALGQMHARPTW